MKRIAKLASFSLLGLVVAVLINGLMITGLEVIRTGAGDSPESYMMIVYAVAIPVALFLGSILTGYLGHPHLKTRRGFVLVSPGLYPCLFMIIVNVVMVYVVKDSSLPFLQNLAILGVFLTWFLSSWGGVGLGSRVRSRGK